MINFINLLKHKFLPRHKLKFKDYFFEIDNHRFKIKSENLLNKNMILWTIKQPYSDHKANHNLIYEKYQSKEFLKLIKTSENFIDLGCQIGYYSLLANEINTTKNIILIDISKQAIKAAKLNFKNNYNKKNVFFHNQALGINRVKYNLWIENVSKRGKKIEDIINVSNYNFNSNDLFKIDIEGYEFSYFQTLRNFIKQTKIKLLFSLHVDEILKLSNNKFLLRDIINDLLKMYNKIYYLSENNGEKIFIRNFEEIPKDNKYPLIICK